jgi:hypothetical protein
MKRRFSIGIFLLTFISTAFGVAIASRLPFHNDDFGGALTEAKQRHLPMFVEVWAPW